MSTAASVALGALRDNLQSGRWKPTWPAVPPDFLANILSEPQGAFP
jgi:hypothetical protein